MVLYPIEEFFPAIEFAMKAKLSPLDIRTEITNNPAGVQVLQKPRIDIFLENKMILSTTGVVTEDKSWILQPFEELLSSLLGS